MINPETPTDPTTPRVLLFGHRGAGKSALIGALLQAGETQGETLRGELVHSSVDLPRIRDAVYSGTQFEPSLRELVSYTVRLQPWRAGKRPTGEALTVVLDDCDGKAAESLLEHPEPITQRDPDSPVARAVVGADAIMLLVDAASTDDEMAEAFVEFDRFLKVVAAAKTDAREVGGFPIFLVLTQCDRLARPGDTLRHWEERVRQRSDAAWKAFDAYLKDADPTDGIPSPFLPFGSVDLTVMAAAVRMPPVAGKSASANQPYGVAELFRDCFAEAKSHRARVRESDRRLKWTVRFAITALAVLLMGLGTVAIFPPEAATPALAEKVRDYEKHEPAAAVKLSTERIDRNKQTLAGFTTDPAYSNLDPALRAFVESRLKEIEDYKAYRAKLAGATSPASARNLPDLEKLCATIRDDLAVPSQYSWQSTDAAELRAKWLADCEAIKAAEKEFVEKYRDLDRDATAQMLARSFDAGWLRGIDSLVARGSQPPFPLAEPIPGSPELKQPRGEPVSYRVPYEFDEAYHARRYWEQTRDRLFDLRDLADALGLTPGPGRPPAVLVLPDVGATDSLTLPGSRWAALQQHYPREYPGYQDWGVGHYPDPSRTILAKHLKQNFDTGVRHVQKLMGVEDTKESWKKLAATLREPAYRDWGRLLGLLAKLQYPGAADPVAELATFLQDIDAKPFELDLKGFQLAIPLTLTVGLDRVEPSGALTVTVTHEKEPPKSAKFTVGKGDTRDKVTVYSLAPDGNGKLAYFAGDELRAELPVKAGDQELKLVWDAGPSKTFQFDRLGREPRLVKPTGGSEPAPGVKLTPLGETVIPQLPVLLPTR